MDRIKIIEDKINNILKELNWDRDYILNTDFESRLERKKNKRKRNNPISNEDENDIKMNIFPIDKYSSVVHFKLNRKYGQPGKNCYHIEKDENNNEIIIVDLYEKNKPLYQYLSEIQDEVRKKRKSKESTSDT